MSSRNRLYREASPYLRQHAENPVHWWPWTAEAFDYARQTDRPVLLSVGYSACHWCHVMAHESFEDIATAALMNKLFVNIKVDREERPDVDHIYMSALHALGQQGGWPLTMFLDCDGHAFWGGTYFPKTPRYGQPAFTDVLWSVSNTFHNKPEDIHQNTQALLQALRQGPKRAPEIELDLPLLDRFAARIHALHDLEKGGIRGAPKFPHMAILELLWRTGKRTGNESIAGPVLTTLQQMTFGGIHDQIGGGYARYSVDEHWLVPHFEKMLYDNAQILPWLALIGKEHNNTDLIQAAEMLVKWLQRDMMTEEGAFASSLDADSLNESGHSEEGAYYVWSQTEINRALEDAAPEFCLAYDISNQGNFEGRSIPNRLHRLTSIDVSAPLMREAREKMLALRQQRSPPARDDKVLADWNGLMILGLVRSAAILEKTDWLILAEKVYAAVVACLGSESILSHAARASKSTHPGFASDHAALALAALALNEATGESRYLDDAVGWCQILLDHYRDPISGIIAMTHASANDLPLRPSPTHDDAFPNANGMAAEAFIRLFAVTAEPHWLNAADDLIAACKAAILSNPFGHASLLNALDLRLRRVDIASVGTLDDEISNVIQSVPFTNRTLHEQSHTNDESSGLNHVLVCSNGQCSLPLRTAEELRGRIDIALKTF